MKNTSEKHPEKKGKFHVIKFNEIFMQQSDNTQVNTLSNVDSLGKVIYISRTNKLYVNSKTSTLYVNLIKSLFNLLFVDNSGDVTCRSLPVQRYPTIQDL